MHGLYAARTACSSGVALLRPSLRAPRRLSTACKRAAASLMSGQGNNGGVPPQQQAQQQQPPVVMLADGRLQQPAPLGAVVTDALRRWYLETEKEALRGDVKAQALLGQMLIEGYGCEADPVKGREWAEKARRRGYRMDGVYCKI